MNKLLTKQIRLIILLVITLILFSLAGVFLLLNDQEGIMLFVLTSLVGIVGIATGLIPALGLTLLLFFIIGSTFFWLMFQSSSIESSVSLSLFFLWMVHLLLVALTTGRLYLQLNDLYEDNVRLREQLNSMVAIDPETGFDNKERMLFELESEFNRSKRYGHMFSFLLIRVRNFDQIQKLYGASELKRILAHLSSGIYRNVRKSDQKFRPEKDLFGLLLVQTSEDDVQRVIDTLDKELTVFQLASKKFITLQLDYGVVSFRDDLDDYLKVYELAKEQVTFHVS